MKKVIIFSTAYLPMIGGAELAVKEITDRINDCEFDLICARLRRDFAKEEKIGQVNVYRIGIGSKIDKILLPFFGFLKARKLYKKYLSLTSNHLSLILWGLMASWGSVAAWLFKVFYPNAPFLLTLQEGDAERSVNAGRRGLINIGWRLILKKADLAQVISNYLAEMARQYGYKGRIEIIPNGVDLDKYQVSSIKYQVGDIRAKFGIGENDKIIITVSRLVEKNGISDLIESFNILNTKYKIHNTKLLIIGSGPLRKRLEDSVKRLDLENRIFFLGDVPNERVPEYLAMADVFVRPSLSEGLGTAFLEAMAAGVPVIATPVGGIPDFLKDPSTSSGQATGLFCEVKNPDSVAEKIKILLEDEDLRQRIIHNARKLVEEKYNWDDIAEKMGELFNKLASAKDL
jgi:glycosyltransferase involved in cell wall biosynthesis